MAPLPTNTTARVFYDYVTGDGLTAKEHTFAIRADSEVPPDTVDAGVRAFLLALGPTTFREGWRIIRSRFHPAGADFSLPRSVTAALAEFIGTNTVAMTDDREAIEWTWQGRSVTTGRRVDFSLYGLNWLIPPSFRLESGGSSPAWVAASVDALNALTSGVFLCIDGTSPVFYDYVNANYNSYWERRIRLG